MDENELPLLPPKNISDWLCLDLKNNFGIETFYSHYKDVYSFNMGTMNLPKEYILLTYNAFTIPKYENNTGDFERFYTIYIKSNGDIEELSEKICDYFGRLSSFTTQKGEFSINASGGRTSVDDENNKIIEIQIKIS